MKIEVLNRKKLIESMISLPIIIFIISIFINCLNINFTANRFFIYINNPIVDIIFYILWIINYILYFVLYFDNSDVMKTLKNSVLWKRVNWDMIFVTLLILFFIISKYYSKVFVLLKVFLLIKIIVMLLDFTQSLYALHKKK